MKMRSCAVAGMFYPQDPSHLEQLLETFFQDCPVTGNSLGIVSPHAGYVYSGQVAADAFSTISPDFSGTFVVIGPSHRGIYHLRLAGPVGNPARCCRTRYGVCPGARYRDRRVLAPGRALDRSADAVHQVPVPQARIAPVMMGQQDYAECPMASRKRLLPRSGERNGMSRIVASSDFSHYVPEQKAKDDDHYAIEPLDTLDVKEFYRRIARTGYRLRVRPDRGDGARMREDGGKGSPARQVCDER